MERTYLLVGMFIALALLLAGFPANERRLRRSLPVRVFVLAWLVAGLAWAFYSGAPEVAPAAFAPALGWFIATGIYRGRPRA
jgi:hypothetical protein